MKNYALKLVFEEPDNCTRIPFAAKDDRNAVISGLRAIKNYLDKVNYRVIQFYIDGMVLGTVDENGEIQTIYPFRLFDSAADPDINLLNDDELGEYLTMVQTIRPFGSRD